MHVNIIWEKNYKKNKIILYYHRIIIYHIYKYEFNKLYNNYFKNYANYDMILNLIPTVNIERIKIAQS